MEKAKQTRRQKTISYLVARVSARRAGRGELWLGISGGGIVKGSFLLISGGPNSKYKNGEE